MKPLVLLFVLLVAAAGTATAQDAPARPSAEAPPGVVLLKLGWSREVEFPRGWERSGPFDASVGSPQDPPPPGRQRETTRPAASPFPQSGRLLYVYHYTAKIRNDGAKEIKAVVWDYVISDPDSKSVLGRHRFYSREKISERERATLRGRSPAPPTRVVTAKGLEKDSRSPFEERFEVRCVAYTDGTLWTHPAGGQSACGYLLHREKYRSGRRAG